MLPRSRRSGVLFFSVCSDLVQNSHPWPWGFRESLLRTVSGTSLALCGDVWRHCLASPGSVLYKWTPTSEEAVGEEKSGREELSVVPAGATCTSHLDGTCMCRRSVRNYTSELGLRKQSLPDFPALSPT